MPAPTVDVILNVQVSQGGTANLVHFTYVDKDGTQPSPIQPDNPTFILLNPVGDQKDITDTSLDSVLISVPTRDSDGSVTGTAGKYYFYIDYMATDAPVGLWVVQTTFTWEGITSVKNLGFNVTSGGGDVIGLDPEVGGPVYAFHKDVENLLLNFISIDANGEPMRAAIDNYIEMAEGEFEDRTGTAYKPITASEESHNLETYRQAWNDLAFPTGYYAKRPVRLMHAPILPFDPARGHKLELFRGREGELTTGDPLRRWDDYLTLTHGRNQDYWFQEDTGRVFIRNTFFIRQGSVVRVTYEWGRPIATLTQPVVNEPTTIYVDSTHQYQIRGYIRIGRSYVFHSGKTATSFTGCRWNQLGTEAEDYASGSSVYSVPQAVRQATAKKAAAMFLRAEPMAALVGDGGGSSPKWSETVAQWEKDWETFILTHQKWQSF